MDQQEFAQQLTEEGFDEVLTTSVPANRQVDAHSHPFAVKAMVLAGEVTLGVAGRQTTYRTGDIYTMARGCEHTELYGPEGLDLVFGRKHR